MVIHFVTKNLSKSVTANTSFSTVLLAHGCSSPLFFVDRSLYSDVKFIIITNPINSKIDSMIEYDPTNSVLCFLLAHNQNRTNCNYFSPDHTIFFPFTFRFSVCFASFRLSKSFTKHPQIMCCRESSSYTHIYHCGSVCGKTRCFFF